MDGNNPNYRIITICHDLQERRVIDRIININKSVPAGYLVCSSYRIYWQQSCSAMDIFTLFLILQMHIHSHGLQLRSSARSCNRHNKNLFGSAIRQLLLLSKYPQIYPKPYPRRTCKSIFQSGIFYTTKE